VGNQGKESVLSERLAFTGRIAASIAHEIRNPLGNVSIAAQQLNKVYSKDKHWSKNIEVIIRNTERINFLITELLNCARPPELNIRPHNMHGIIENVLNSIRSSLSIQWIEVIKKFDAKPSIINVDKEHINRVFLNLVINAVEAMPKGGTMTISTSIEGDFFVVKIQDTGVGIPEEDIIKIFDPFFTSKEKGTGLGLSVVYGIINSHQGTIEVDSKAGEGTTITITLPTEITDTETSPSLETG
jgi:signal transduction histidine kinase